MPNTLRQVNKIKRLIEKEAQDVETENMLEYMEKVLLACAVLKQVTEGGKTNEMPREQLIDIIDAVGSTLMFSRDLLREVQNLLA